MQAQATRAEIMRVCEIYRALHWLHRRTYRLGPAQSVWARQQYYSVAARLARVHPPNLVPIRGGGKMFVHAQDRFISDHLLRQSIWEESETALVRSLPLRGQVALDLGANIGYFTILLSRLVGPAGRVYAFEPDPANFALLRRNVELNRCGNVVAENKAVGSANRTLQLYLAPDNLGDHQLFDSGERRSAIEVPCVRLDDYLVPTREQVGFIKMDIQGSEASALEGMQDLIAGSANVRMLTEFSPYHLSRAGHEAAGFLDRLAALGFYLRVLQDKGRHRPTTREELLSRFGAATDMHCNLVCAKGV